jgi:hypothetical protein
VLLVVRMAARVGPVEAVVAAAAVSQNHDYGVSRRRWFRGCRL